MTHAGTGTEPVADPAPVVDPGPAVDSGPAVDPELAVDPEVRITAHVFERAYGHTPAGVWRAPGGLTLLGGGPELAVALPWGVIAALGPAGDDGTAEFYSMSHHADRFSVGRGRLPAALAAGAVPEWALPAVNALITCDRPATRVMVNRELPAEMGLLTGAETACAVELGLGAGEARPGGAGAPSASYLAARHARADHALLITGNGAGAGAGSGVAGRVEHLPCDLTAIGLRLLIMDVGASAAPPARPAGALAERAAAALRAGSIPALGPLLTEAHARGEATLDLALDTAREAGALGGLVIGRCGVALVPMSAVPKIRAAVTTRLAGRARRAPRFLTATPSPGAARAM
ncbi:hypothetical protein [Spirillospora sp. NPDC047279]|uniref:hypothetical protein n=1 Tax=Spirillospora sp. NPDC047279 TaxID=3155478 RepID=UPI0033EC1B2F